MYYSTIFQNPLASPSILGASSGAVLFTLIAGSVFSPIFQPFRHLLSFLCFFNNVSYILEIVYSIKFRVAINFWFCNKHSYKLYQPINNIFNLSILKKRLHPWQFMEIFQRLASCLYRNCRYIPPFVLSIIRAPKYDILALGKDLRFKHRDKMLIEPILRHY